MTVPVQTPVANHIGNGVATSFSFDFKLLDEDDILVTVDDVVQVLGINYTVSGVGAESGGTVTFAAAPSAPAPVSLVRQVALNRLTDYQYSGDFQSPEVNRDFDRIIMMLQDSGLALANTLRLPSGDPADGVLPSAAARALQVLGFDASGNLALVPATAGDATALGLALASFALPSQGAGLLGYKHFAAGAVGRTLTSKLGEFVSVKDFGAIGNGVVNDTSAVQAAFNYAALNSGTNVFFPAGTYLIRSAITIPSNTRAYGAGRTVSRVKADAANWTPMAPGKGSARRMFTNTNFEAGAITDSGISVECLGFDWAGTFWGDAHSVTFRMASRISIRQCDFYDGGNGTALLACQDTVTDDCYASGQTNAGFDHWDGAVGAKVTNCVVRAPNAVQGIQVTGASTSGSPVRASSDVVIMGNSVYGCTGLYASGIIVNSISSGSSVSSAHINSNHVSGASIGIAVTGGCGAVLVSNNTVDGSDEVGMFVGTDTSGQYPTACIVDGNLFTNCSATPGNIGVIAITGGTDHLLQGNKVYLGTGSYDFACYVAAAVTGTKLVNNQFQIGALGVVSNPAFASLEDYEEGTFTPALTFGGGATGLGYAARAGRYTKKGRLVFYEMSIQLSAKGSSTGNASVGGLPYGAGVTPAARPTGSVMFQNMNSIGYTIIGNVSGAGIALQNGSTTSELAQLTETNFNNNTNLFISGFYSI